MKELRLSPEKVSDLKHELMMVKVELDGAMKRFDNIANILADRPIIVLKDSDSRKPAHENVSVNAYGSHSDGTPEEYRQKAIVTETRVPVGVDEDDSGHPSDQFGSPTLTDYPEEAKQPKPKRTKEAACPKSSDGGGTTGQI